MKFTAKSVGDTVELELADGTVISVGPVGPNPRVSAWSKGGFEVDGDRLTERLPGGEKVDLGPLNEAASSPPPPRSE